MIKIIDVEELCVDRRSICATCKKSHLYPYMCGQGNIELGIIDVGKSNLGVISKCTGYDNFNTK